MMKLCKRILKKIKLFVLYFTRIVFVKNNFKVSFFTKLKANTFGGYLADQYVLYDLKHNDKKEYLSEFDWYKSRYINEPFDFAFNNKVICSEILKHYIKIPKNYFIKNKGIILDFNRGPVSKEDVYTCLKEKHKLFLKPLALGKGNGVHLLSIEKNEIYLDERKCTEAEFYNLLNNEEDYILCEYIKQHSYAAHLYDKTSNTIRLITLRDIRDHEFKIYFAVQRIGRKETIPIDNGSKGGLVAKINLNTGELSEARCLYDLKQYYFHPDSGSKIKGVQVAMWNEIKSEILNVCKKIPYMDFIAWDLLVTEKGVCVIEANNSSGVNILQLWEGQRRKELGVFFKYHNVIKGHLNDVFHN